jgi:hypothetical protein
MKKIRLKQKIQRIITEVLNEDHEVDMHRCLTGKSVPMSTPECILDLENRLLDAAADRDDCNTRTDARVHYNGVLKVLRRKLSQARKLQPGI